LTQSAKAHTHDGVSRRELIDRLGSVSLVGLSKLLFRSSSPGYAALSGEGARISGGRWNPPDSFPVVYAATDVSAAALEVYRTAARYGVAPAQLLPRVLWSVDTRLERVLDFSQEPVRRSAGLPLSAMQDDDMRLCQAYGDAAHYLGIEAIVAPSNAAPGANTVAIYVARLGARSRLEIVASQILDTDQVT
jgi:RES domain-containing protein